MFYIQNFVPWNDNFAEECMGWSWYMACDFQLFLPVPFILLAHKYHLWLGYGLCFVYCAAQMIDSLVVDNSQRVTPFLNIILDKLYDVFTMDQLYVKPWAHGVPFGLSTTIEYMCKRST